MKEMAKSVQSNESASLQRYASGAYRAKQQPNAEINPLKELVKPLSCKGSRSSLSDLCAKLPAAPLPASRLTAMPHQKSQGIGFGQAPAVQAKLTVGPADDEYEREADRVAEQAVSMAETPVQRACPSCEEEAVQAAPLAAQITPLVQRQAAPEEEEEVQAKPLVGPITPSIQRLAAPEEEEEIQAKPLVGPITPSIQREAAPEEEEEVQAKSLFGPITPSIQREAAPEEEEEIQAKPLVGPITPSIQRLASPEEEEEIQTKRPNDLLQRKEGNKLQAHSLIQRASSKGEQVGLNLEQSLAQARGNGSSLEGGVRGRMERSFGVDFGSVRIHSDAQADRLNRSIQARAFTSGQDIFLRQGEYRPASSEGQRLLAHELTHVVQQNRNRLQKNQINEMQKVIPGALLEKEETSDVSSKAFRATIEKVRSSMIQRVVLDGANGKVLLDSNSTDSEIAQKIASWIFEYRSREKEFKSSFDDLLVAVKVVLSDKADFKNYIVGTETKIPLSEIGIHISREIDCHHLISGGKIAKLNLSSSESSHLKWLLDELEKYEKQSKDKITLLPLLSHDMALNDEMFKHFNHFDDNMIWRFSSTPTAENVFVAAGTPYSEVLRVIAAHSGGNDKSNPNVKTLSFGRNIGALMGTALSEGGDKHVTNIIDKAEYLVGIDITSLPILGISAHPARARAISLFETEYVLVNSPGNPPRSLVDLATKIYRNPFKNGQEEMLKETKKKVESFKSIETEMGKLKAELIYVKDDFPQERMDKISLYAKAVAEVASEFSSTVRSKDQIHPDEINSIYRKCILNYIIKIEKALRQPQNTGSHSC